MHTHKTMQRACLCACFNQNMWAIPGGFVNENESLDMAASRELQEETSVPPSAAYMTQVGMFGDPGRDPRGWVVSAAYVSLLAGVCSLCACVGWCVLLLCVCWEVSVAFVRLLGGVCCVCAFCWEVSAALVQARTRCGPTSSSSLR